MHGHTCTVTLAWACGLSLYYRLPLQVFILVVYASGIALLLMEHMDTLLSGS